MEISHTGICVSSIEVSSRFYCNVLEFEMGKLFTTGRELAPLLGIDGDLEFQCQFVFKNNFLLELLQFKIPGHVGSATARPMNKLGFTHLSFRVDRIDPIVAKVIEYGGALIESSRTRRQRPSGYTEEVVFCTDPDGTRLELMVMPNSVRFI
jgi:catechol 2,3-dioxygenase-like lactoylglutathione lyase family enzyme